MTSLIARLQSAADPTRELADEVLTACGWKFKSKAGWWHRPLKNGASGLVWSTDRLNPLVSIDAALSLMPDELFWMFSKGRLTPSEPLYGIQILDPSSGLDVVVANSEHDCLGIALCIAILKARDVK